MWVGGKCAGLEVLAVCVAEVKSPHKLYVSPTHVQYVDCAALVLYPFLMAVSVIVQCTCTCAYLVNADHFSF